MSTALRCHKCGYDFSGLGDSAHVCLQQTLTQPKQEQNFCSRCGKRTSDLNDIHTCTPPKQEQDEPVAFKIYKPTPPRHAITNVRDAELPWVYDQDPSSGNVASMWVTPVQTLRSKL